jgi:hypothetical protein
LCCGVRTGGHDDEDRARGSLGGEDGRRGGGDDDIDLKANKIRRELVVRTALRLWGADLEEEVSALDGVPPLMVSEPRGE